METQCPAAQHREKQIIRSTTTTIIIIIIIIIRLSTNTII
jgi:hypothetical protein